tara:strand:+ start:155 stop:379 length:225 start_codon:yes stop_codon:yes gene_type:complete
MMDLTNFRETQEPTKIRTILTCYVRLDKNTMLNALQSDSIFIDGQHFKVPENTLLMCLINKKFGETKLELELIK